jgi:predicted DsbA family dithiol-disulfide isomerase
MSDAIKVDVWSDIACPWCYIGKRKFEAGAEAFGGAVEVEYHSFELAPDTPVDFAGSEIDFLVQHKGFPAEQIKPMLDRVSGIAAEVGLDYDFDALQHTNTIKAHQLLHFAKANGKQVEMKERLLRAYFVEGRHVGRDSDLADLAAEIGLDREAALAALADDAYLADVRADQQQAIAYGIQGVPFFVVDGKYGVSGAQSPETFTSVLEKVASERSGVAS